MKYNVTKVLVMALTLIASLGFTACDDDDFSGEPNFEIEGVGENNVYNLTYAAVDTTSFTAAKKLVVRSNRPWKLVAEGENGWCRVFPAEGEGDGIIRVSATENSSPESRKIVYHIYLAGQEYGTPLTIQQDGSEPYLNPSANSITISRKGGATQFQILANIPYTYEIIGTDTDWLTVQTTSEANVLIFSTPENPASDARTVTLHVQGTGEFSNLSFDVPITQLGALFFENFSWMNHTDTSILGWLTAGESNSRYDKWTEEEKSYGWTSRSTWCYGRPGFIKLGKTNYGGDVVSPKLTEIQGTLDVNISFQAVGYCSAGGALDDKVVYVALTGGGTIKSITGGNGGDITNGIAYVDESGNAITLNNVAAITLTDDNNFNPTTDPTGLLIWDNANTNYTLSAEGATSNTQIIFLGGTYDSALKGVGQGKNRIFLDNIKVEEK